MCAGQPPPHLCLPSPQRFIIIIIIIVICSPRILAPSQRLPRRLRAADTRPRPRGPGSRHAADRRRAPVDLGLADGHGDEVRGRGGHVGERGQEAGYHWWVRRQGGGFETCWFPLLSFFFSFFFSSQQKGEFSGWVCCAYGLEEVSRFEKLMVLFCVNACLRFPSWHQQAFKALQTAYIRLLQNPFYKPPSADEQHAPTAGGSKSGEITSHKFIAEVKRIGELWRPGLEKV